MDELRRVRAEGAAAMKKLADEHAEAMHQQALKRQALQHRQRMEKQAAAHQRAMEMAALENRLPKPPKPEDVMRQLLVAVQRLEVAVAELSRPKTKRVRRDANGYIEAIEDETPEALH